MTFLENLTWRYATKKFNNQKVSEENLQKIKDAIKMAPTSFGTQPFHVEIISNKDILELLKKVSPNNESKLETCSHLLVFCARTDLQKRFLGIEKLKGLGNSFLAQAAFGFQHFLSVISIFKMGKFLTKTSWARNQTYVPLGFALAACAELKVDSCPMEGFNAQKYAKVLKLGSIFKPSVILAIGYRDESDKIYPKARFPEDDLFTEIK